MGDSRDESGSAAGQSSDGRRAAGEVTLIAVRLLVDHDSPRTGPLDEGHVAGLAEVGSELPPVLVHRESLLVLDGRHRLSAALKRGEGAVSVEFFEGSVEDGFVEAVRRNARHGLPLDLADRRAAALRILVAHPEWSDGVVADRSGLSPTTVAAVRRSEGVPSPLVRRGRDGRGRPTDAADRRRLVEEFFAEHPASTLRQAAEAAEVSPSTAKLVRDAMHARASRSRPAALRIVRPVSAIAEPVTEPGHPSSPQAGAPAADPASPSGRRPSSDEVRGRVTATTEELLRRLGRDPSVRSSECCRGFLRVAALCLDLPATTVRVPAHSQHLMAALARRCADHWTAVAVSLEAPRRG